MNSCTSLEAKRKHIQLATFFQILSDGRPIVEFESRSQLYYFLQVPHCPRAHWSHTSGWILSENIYLSVQENAIVDCSSLLYSCNL